MDRHFIVDFLKNTFLTSFGTISSILFHFLSIMIMTRNLPKDEFGLYTLILVVVHCLTILVGLGLDLTMVKFLSSGTNSVKENVFFPIVMARIALTVCFTVVILFVGKGTLGFFDQRMNTYLGLITMFFILSNFRNLFFHTLQGLRQFKKYAFIQTFSAIFRFVLVVVYVRYNNLTILTLLYIEIFVPCVTIFLQLVVIPLKSLSNSRPTLANIKNVLHFGMPLYLNNILTVVMDRINIFLIGAFLNLESIAIFEVAGKIPEGFSRIFRSFIIVLFPNLSKLFSGGNRSDAQKIINQSLVFVSLGISFLILVTFSFRKEIIVLLFSDNYLKAELALPMLMLDFFLRSVSNIIGYSIVSAGYPSVPVKTNTVSMIVLIFSSLILIPLLGITGAIFSLLLMNVTSQIIYLRYLSNVEISVSIFKYLKPLFISAVSVGAQLFIGPDFLMVKFLSLALYPVLCWLFMPEFRIWTASFGKFFKKRFFGFMGFDSKNL